MSHGKPQAIANKTRSGGTTSSLARGGTHPELVPASGSRPPILSGTGCPPVAYPPEIVVAIHSGDLQVRGARSPGDLLMPFRSDGRTRPYICAVAIPHIAAASYQPRDRHAEIIFTIQAAGGGLAHVSGWSAIPPSKKPACASRGKMLPPLGLGAILPVSEERPIRRRAAHQRDELTASHETITLIPPASPVQASSS